MKTFILKSLIRVLLMVLLNRKNTTLIENLIDHARREKDNNFARRAVAYRALIDGPKPLSEHRANLVVELGVALSKLK